MRTEASSASLRRAWCHQDTGADHSIRSLGLGFRLPAGPGVLLRLVCLEIDGLRWFSVVLCLSCLGNPSILPDHLQGG